MKDSKELAEKQAEELPDSWWYRIYLAVIINTIIVILLLRLFGLYFSD
jgi:hypothetical protein